MIEGPDAIPGAGATYVSAFADPVLRPDLPSDACHHQLFAAQAARTPEAVALSWRGERVTYAQLEARANRLANALRRRGVGPEVRVGICLPRTPELVAAMLGVLKAGGAYVPLDPAYPRERLGYMIEDAAISLVVADAALADALPEGAATLLLDRERDAIAAESADAPESGVVPENLSHVIFTSGSTGRPKGVMIRHASVVVLLQWLRENVTDQERASVLFSTSINFDVSVAEIFGTLAWGGTLVIAENALELAALDEPVVYASMVPSAAAELLRGGGIPASVKTLNLGGEALPNALAQGLYALGTVEKVGNLYGPTEDTTYSTYHLVPRGAGEMMVGRPVTGTEAHVLDAGLRPVPAGQAGELYLAGDGLSRGYANHPAMTAERFVPCPFGAPGSRMYRVMDRVRWRESAGVDSVSVDSRTDALPHSRTAVLEYLGRTDFQVKVRGYRIELGEIEARLAEHPQVHEAVVLAREDAPGDRRLVAYLLGGEAAGAEVLRAHLAERLPEYMVPAAYVRMERWPLTPNGKLDRAALPAPADDAYGARAYEAPAGETERVVAGVWAQVLGTERVGRGDHFFELGGHSLLAGQVISRVRQALGVDVLARDLFDRPVLADFAAGLATAARAQAPALVPADRSGPLALSFAQQRLWFLEQLGGTGAAYHVPTSLRLRGELDHGALVRALHRIVARHEALRTTFAAVDGEPVQRVAPAAESGFQLVEHDLRAAPDAENAVRRIMSDEAGAPFDLANGPLFRGRLVRMAADDHVLALTMHHIVSDGWSLGVLHRELGVLYAAFARGEPDPLPPLPVQYADYAAWHRGWVEGPVLDAQAEYWTRTLAGAPELLALPTDHPRPSKQDFAGASVQVELDEAATAALRALGQRHGATLYMTLLAGWAAVLARLSGQDDVVIGTPSANRGEGETEGLIGFFVNTLALRVDLSDSPSVAGLLARVKAGVLEAQRNQDIPFEQVVERVRPARSLAHTPLFQVMLAWQEMPDAHLELPGIAAVPLPADEGAAPFDLTLSIAPRGGRIAGTLTYATALFDRATVERHAGYLRRALVAMAADERRAVDRLPLLPDAERRLVLERWNDTDRGYPRGACVHDLFRAQAARTPEAVALSWRGERLTYGEVARRANRISHALRRRGAGPEVRVGICLPRTPELVPAMLGVLGAGAAYVPLDPAYPRERLGYMLEDADATLVITDSTLADRLPEGVSALLLDGDRDAIAAESVDAPESGVVPENLSHVIFTSGSTGRPKGVMIRHASVVVLLHWLRENVTDEERAAVLFSTSINFDVSVAEVFGTLAWGGTLVLVENALELAALDEPVVHVSMVPSAAAELLRGGGIPASVKTLNLGGEALPNALAQGLYALPAVEKVGNLYGPTEDTTYSTYSVVERGADRVLVGAPVANTRAYVLDAHLQPVPVGAEGELYLAGDGLSRGYANRPAMTAERFVPCPFGAPGGRMYRVMDRVRWKARASVRECGSAVVGDSRKAGDGQRGQPPFTPALTHSRPHALEYRGRIDFQVKVRGFRIELGEIEARLAEHPGVRAPVVVVREDAPGDRRLVAYYLADRPAAVDALTSHLAERLPEYMVPAAYVWMDAYPQTPNGKTDRKALPAPKGDAYAARSYEAPAGETEQAVSAIWAEVLGGGPVGRRDHFFELGGHSLMAMRVVSRVRQALGVEARPGDLFERPVLSDFARGLATAARAESTAVAPVERSAPLPLSFAQRRLWLLEQLGSLGSTYHIPTALRLRGELDRGALVRALDHVVARHEVLRTAFPAVDGEPVQHVVPAGESAFRLVEHDLRASADAEDDLRRITEDEAGAPFDLARGPLIRGRLVRMAEDDHVLLVTMHHIVSDGWSLGVLRRELGALYAAFARGDADPLPPLPIQYADYAVWHRGWVEGPVLEAQAEYWSRTLAGAPELLELPADHPRPAKQDFAGASVPMELDEALAASLRALSQRHGTTLYMTLLAGWAVVLARLSGRDDVVIGTPSANRARPEVEPLIGFFVNTLALRVDLSDSPSVAGLLVRVKAGVLEAQRNQDIPFEQVVERVRPARSLAYTPLFQVMFAWQNAPDDTLRLPGLAVVAVDAAESTTAKFDLTLALGEEGGRVTGSAEYAASLFDQATVERHLAYLRRVLEGMVADDLQPVDALPLLPEAERRLVVEAWNATDAAYPRELCIHEMVQAQVERAPDAVAVAFGDQALTYPELNTRANRLAHHLRTLGVGPDVRVAVCAERSLELVVGMLGVLKAGGAYVPLDPANPAERLRYMLTDSAPAVVLTQTSLLASDEELFAGLEAEVLALDAPVWGSQPAADPERGTVDPSNLAYVIYTSGSTGLPKGVMIAHRTLANLVHWHVDASGLKPGDRSSSVASIGFDASGFEIWPALCSGATLLLPHDARNPQALLEWWTRQRLDVSFLPTPVAEFAFDRGMSNPSLRMLLVGGDQLRHLPADRGAMRVVNNYGPTEATIVATFGEMEREDALHIGRPIRNGRIYILDRRGEPVPVGVAGELYVGGAGIGRGYLGRPALTAERFVPDAFGGEPGARLYRTGDLARWRPDGNIDFLGRNDFQVKIRGFRIELGEIEARLRDHDSVREAVVLAREDAAGEKRLVAYCTSDAALDVEALRAHLGERLPEYMVPAAYVRLEALPLTSNGKLDRRALPAPEADAFVTRGYEAPVGETEQALAEVWSELLRVRQVGRRDNFFELGGHSLVAVRVVSRVREALGVEVVAGDLFERPVLANFARGLENAARAQAAAIVPADRSGPLALSFAQQRLWFLEQLGGTGAAYHIPTTLRLRGPLDAAALVRALDRVVARHEALRTAFPTVDGEPVQHVAPAEVSGFRLVEHDLRAAPDAEDALRRIMGDEAGAPFDLARGPLIRGRLVRMAADDHVLLLTIHHIVSDGWSMGVLHRELGALYAAFARGDADPLPPLPIQYADYAVWHRRWVDGPVLEAQAEYWGRTLAGAPELLELPTDHPRPARQDFAGASVNVALDEAATAALKALGQRHGATLFMTLLAGWAAVLARLSGQDDVVIGTPSANRGRPEVEALIGFFVNTLPLRVDLSDGPTVAELLARVKARALEAQRNQDIPFEQVVERVRASRSLAYSPLFQAMFAWQNAPDGTLALPGLAVVPVDGAERDTAKFDLTLTLWEEGERIAGTVEYATALFAHDTVERFVDYLRRVLAGMTRDDGARVDGIPLLPPAERARLVDTWSHGAAVDPSRACIHTLFEAQAARTPRAVALIHEGERLTYAELDARANRLAHRLAAAGVERGVAVGVCLEWRPELVVALLATLKAGGVYVPLDPSLPAGRLAYIADDAGLRAVVTRAALADRVPEGAVRVDVDADDVSAASSEAPRVPVSPADLAYVIYTSGSTGRPKGVAVEHGPAAAHLVAVARVHGIGPHDRVLQFASAGFDVSLEQVFFPLLTGATLVLRGAELWSAEEFRARVRDLGITVANLPPAYWQEVANGAAGDALDGIRLMLVGGDALPSTAADALGAGTLVNCYGPTETVVTATAFAVERGAAGGASVPIGRPLPGRAVYVLDPRGAPVPAGVAGELYIGGPLLARGYLGRPALTAERFVPDPFSARPGGRLYRTGDRVRWKDVRAGERAEARTWDGDEDDSRGEALALARSHARTFALEFLGRTDFQVKIRGFRIELGEIEAALRGHDAVRDALVLAREDAPGDRRLVAYYLAAGPAAVEALKAHLAERLPEYMVPAAYVWMEAFPLTPNGKADRRALPVPGSDAFAAAGYAAPDGETEEAVAAIWADLLGVERVGRHDHFFHLGGNSLLATRLVFRIRREMDVEIPVSDVFEKPELALLAQHLLDAQLAQFDPDQLQELLALARAAEPG